MHTLVHSPHSGRVPILLSFVQQTKAATRAAALHRPLFEILKDSLYFYNIGGENQALQQKNYCITLKIPKPEIPR